MYPVLSLKNTKSNLKSYNFVFFISKVAEEVLSVTKKMPREASNSPIWEEDIRNEVKVTKIPEQKLNAIRSQLLVPGMGFYYSL